MKSTSSPANNPITIGIVSPMGTDKSIIQQLLQQQGFIFVEIADHLRDSLQKKDIQTSAKTEEDEDERSVSYLKTPIEQLLSEYETAAKIAVSGIRHREEIDLIRNQDKQVVIIGLTAKFNVRLKQMLDQSAGNYSPDTEDKLIMDMIADWKGNTHITGLEELLRKCDYLLQTGEETENYQIRCRAIIESLLQSKHRSDLNMDMPNENFQEIEKRAIINYQQYSLLLQKLNEEGIKVGSTFITDTYLCPSNVQCFSEIEMNKIGSYSLRIRQEIENQKEKVTINVKVITTERDHEAWNEHEITTDSFEAASSIFANIGYKNYFTLKKQRQAFHWKGVDVCLENIDNFGYAIEFEIIAPSSLAHKMKEKLAKLMNDIGIDKDQNVPKSITNMMMKKFARF